ncbi:MAG: hypothetical protein RR889_02075 [Akkermansia sp.]
MFIPTQEERYSKKSLVTLSLCVMAPSVVYAYLIADRMLFPVDSIMGMLNLILFFTYPLAFVFSKMGIPWYFWGIICSLLVHVGGVGYIYRSEKITPKHALVIAVTVGMLELLILKMMNAMPS